MKNPNLRNENERDPFKKVNELFARITQSLDIHARQGFKEALKQRILEARHNTSMRFSLSWFHRLSPKLAGGGFAALIVVIVVMLVFGPFLRSVPVVYAQDNFTLIAEQEDSLGVDPATNFIIESKDEIQMDFLKKYLSTDIDVEFELNKIDEHHARVTFAKPLDQGQMVRFILISQTPQADGTARERPYEWAFQVKKSFQVLNTIPGNKTSRVPLDSGIEVVFSHENVTTSDFEKAFSITPAVKGHFEKNRRSIVFVPDALTPSAVYEVRISSSLTPDSSSETLAKDYTFKFETDRQLERGSYIDFFDHDVTVTPQEKTELKMGTEDYYESQSLENVSLQVYQFPTYETFRKSFLESTIDRWRYNRSFKEYINLSDLKSIGIFSPEVVDSDYGPIYRLPIGLDEGYYGVVATYKGKDAWLFIQSVSISATVVESDGDYSLVWTHDTNTKQPLASAQVEGIKLISENEKTFETSPVVVSSNEGVARISFAPEAKFTEVISGDRSLLLLLESSNYGWGLDGWWDGPNSVSVDDNYWGYLYSDRTVYKAGDTVHVWGFAKPRNGQSLPKTAKIKLTSWVFGYSYENSSSDSIEYSSVDVQISPEGTFIGELTLPDMIADSLTLSVEYGDLSVLSRSIQVQEYRKPVYTLDLKFDKKAVIKGESIGFMVKSNYFDGTPVVGKTVNVGDWYTKIPVVLSAEGTASGTLQITNVDSSYNQASLSEPGLEPVDAYSNFYIYSSSIVVLGDGKIKDGVATVNVDTRQVQITDSDDRTEDYKNVSPNTSVKVSAKEIYYEKIKTENTYDFIRKIVRENFRYERRENDVYSGTVVTDAQGKASVQFNANRPDASYEIRLSATDSQGRTDIASVYPFSNENYAGGVDYSDPYLTFFDPQTDIENAQKFDYKIGEEVKLEVRQFGKKFEMIKNGKFLFIEAQQGIKQYSFSSAPEYSFTFGEQHIPNVTVFGVLFTGDGYVTVNSRFGYTSGHRVDFDKLSRKLDVDLVLEQEQYRPGQNANVQVVVKDKNGNPVSAEVNISVVDEAYFAVFPEYVDPLNVLYQRLPSGISGIISSHKRELGFGGAEGGGGGEGEIRSNFVDTAAFIKVQTNNEGIANVQIPLPDNITSWRFTTQAIDTKGLQAGIITKNIATTLPFFINASVQPTYLTEDQPEILATAAGTQTKITDPIHYELFVDDQKASSVLNTTVGARAHLALPKLTEGAHTITIKAQTGSLKDAVAYPIKIVKSRLSVPVVEEQILQTDTKLSGAEQGLTYVTFVDGNVGKYYRDLAWMSWRYGDRADEATVRFVATKVLNDVFSTNVSIPELDIGSYQSGGIRLLPYSDFDPILTAKIALLKETPFDETEMRGALLSWLYGVDSDRVLSPVEAAWAYAGLAALDTPILSEAKRFAKQELTDEARLALAIAYAYSGDKESARDIYEKLMESAKRELKYVWVERETPEETKEANAQLALLAAMFNEVQDRDGLRAYVENQAQGQTLTVLEELATIKSALPFIKSGASKVSFNLRGETKTVELAYGNSSTIAVSAEELSKLQPTVTSGSVSVITSYQKPISSFPNVYDKISVKRRFIDPKTKKDITSFKENDLVRVELTFQIDASLPKEVFQITESVPSGLTPVTWRGGIEIGDYCVTYPETDTDQTLTFFASVNWYSQYCPRNMITYYARVLNTGTFKAEPASIRASRDPSLINFSNENTITIQE
ncbi:Ig-like domain-containing protein [Candidatus Uhrbacteria bacterium]|nr:Ig-like domain-containing protein [Candidatus Uhrbacteria bacterium]